MQTQKFLIAQVKFKPAYLFYLLTIISVGFLIGTWKSTTDIAVHNTYFVIDYKGYFIITSALSLLTAFIYSFMDKKGRPINKQTGIIHFALIFSGLVLSFNIYRVIIIVLMTGAPDTAAIAFDLGSAAITFGGPMLLLCGLIVFVYGLVKAVRINIH